MKNMENMKKMVSKIRINGFKSIKQTSIELGKLNVLIGSNGSGKTNFISIFKLLEQLLAGRLQGYVGKHGGPDGFLHFGRKSTERLEIKLDFGKCGYSVELAATADDRLMIDAEKFWGDETDELLIGGGYFESNWKKARNDEVSHTLKLLLSGLKWQAYHFHDAGETALVKQIHGINDNILLASDARNLAAFLYRLQSCEATSYGQIVQAIRLVAPYFDDFVLRANPLKEDTIRLEWKNTEDDVPFLASQLSDGTLRFMCLATLLLQPLSLMPDLILIDEPELGLHPYAISVLAALIKKAAVHKQVIVSTQSVELLNRFEAKDVIVVDHKTGESIFSRIDETSLQAWLTNDYTLGDLWNKNIFGGRP
jgi:predicted ATPase